MWKSTKNKVRLRDQSLTLGLFAFCSLLYYRAIGFNESEKWRTRRIRALRGKSERCEAKEVQQRTLAVDERKSQQDMLAANKRKAQQDTLAVNDVDEKYKDQHGGWLLMTSRR